MRNAAKPNARVKTCFKICSLLFDNFYVDVSTVNFTQESNECPKVYTNSLTWDDSGILSLNPIISC